MSDFVGSDLERYISEAQRDYKARMADAQYEWEKKGEEKGEKRGRKEGRKEGEKKGKREMLMTSIERFSQKRFGKTINDLSKDLKKKTLDELQDLLDTICLAPSYDDFLAQL